MNREQAIVDRLFRAAANDAPAEGAKERALEAVARGAMESVVARAAPAPLSAPAPWVGYALGTVATFAAAAGVALVAHAVRPPAARPRAAAPITESAERAPAPQAAAVPMKTRPRQVASTAAQPEAQVSCSSVDLPDAQPTACSTNSPPYLLEVVNNCASDAVDLYWINFDCKEIFYNQLKPGAVHSQSTFVTHPWRVRDHATHRLLKEIGPLEAHDEGATPTLPSEEEVAFVVGPTDAAEASDSCSEAGTRARIAVENRRDAPVEMYWLDYDCREDFKGFVAPGETWHQNTVDAHRFRVRDASTHALLKELVLNPDAEGRRVRVTIP